MALKIACVTLFALCLFSASCAGPAIRPDQLYAEGLQDIEADSAIGRMFRDCRSAGIKLRHFVTQNPFDKRAPLAQKRLAECYVEEESWADAESAWRAFLALYPGHSLVPVALLGQADAAWQQREALNRDPTKLRNSLALYARLIREYPASEQAGFATEQYNIIRNMLAEHSWKIGRYYERVRHPLAAYTRYKATWELFQSTEFGQKAHKAMLRLEPKLSTSQSN